MKGGDFLSKYRNSIVCGLDVASEFSIACILDPEGNVGLRSYKIIHSLQGFNSFLSIVNDIVKSHNQAPIVFALESTGIYHMTLLTFLKNNNFEVLLINPLITNSNKNNSIRKVKNDKKDAFSIANLVKYQDIKVSFLPSLDILRLRAFIREYFYLGDEYAKFKLKLGNVLAYTWPGYSNVFSDIASLASINILSTYPSATSFLNADKADILKLLSPSRKGSKWCETKYSQLLSCANDTSSLSNVDQPFIVQSFVSMISSLDKNIGILFNSLQDFINSKDFDQSVKYNIDLIKSIPGCGFISAVAIIAEIGDFARFSKPKELIAYFGLDPEVNQSGKFTADKVKISKRGPRIARRALFFIALASIRKGKNKQPINSVLKAYYDKKCVSKVKMSALSCVMHKIVKILFSVLREQKTFSLRTPEDHINQFLNNQAA